MESSSRPVDGSASRQWVSHLKSIATKAATAHEVSIQDIYKTNSNELFGQASAQEKKEIAEHLTTIIDIKSTKLEDTIKQANAMWITVLKVVMAVTVVLIPVAAIVHAVQAKTTGAAEKELGEIEQLKNQATELGKTIKDNLKFIQQVKLYTQEIYDIVDVMNHKKEIEDIQLRLSSSKEELAFFVAIDNKQFASDAVANCNSIIKETPLSDTVVIQFYKDIGRGYVVRIHDDSDQVYTNPPINSARNDWKKEHPDKELPVNKFVQDVVTDVNKALGDDAARWSKPIQALCTQSSFFDMSALQVSRTNNQWHDSTEVAHKLDATYPCSFDVLITRSKADPTKIEKVTISLETPIALAHFTNEKAVEEFDHSLTYHLSMEVTLDSQNQPKIEVLRREFTKEGV